MGGVPRGKRIKTLNRARARKRRQAGQPRSAASGNAPLPPCLAPAGCPGRAHAPQCAPPAPWLPLHGAGLAGIPALQAAPVSASREPPASDRRLAGSVVLVAPSVS